MNNEYTEALQALHIAENHFAEAAPNYIEAAILELAAAEKRLAAVTRQQQKERR